jgi:hypothetical protein
VPFSTVLLKDDGGLAELKLAPSDASFRGPLVGKYKPEAVDLEAKRRLEVGHVKEGDRLLDVGGVAGHL